MGERLAIDPNKNSILFLGTRGTNGLWKSANFGSTWTRVDSFPSTGNYLDPFFNEAFGIPWIVFDARSGSRGHATQTIYAGVVDTNTSIYRSTDGGATWSAVPGQPTGFFPHHAVLASNGVLYVTYGSTPGPFDLGNGDVWKLDTNSGAWTSIRPTTDNWYGFGGLAVDASDPDVLMVATMNQWWPDDNLWRSTDGGASWTPMWTWGPWPTRDLRYTLDYSAAPYLDWGGTAALPEMDPKLGWMIGDLEIDPFDSDSAMYVTGATAYGIDNLTNLDSGGNVNLSVKAEGLEETAVNDLLSPPVGEAHLLSVLGDIGGFTHNDLSVSPAGGMSKNPLLGSSTSLDAAGAVPEVVARVGWVGRSGQRGGYSENVGQTWQPFVSESFTGNGAGQIAVSADGATFLWDPNDVGAHYTADRGATWTPSAGLPDNEVAIAADRVNPDKFYAFDNETGQLFLSTDGAATFAATGATVPLPADPTQFLEAKMTAVPGREGDLWVATRLGGMWHTTNSGTTLTKLTVFEEASTIGLGKAAPGQTYMALYTAGKINGVHGLYRSDDGGAHWVRINDDGHRWGWIGAAITGDPRIYGRVYVSTNGRGIQYGDIVTCEVDYDVRRQRNGDFTAGITIKNLGQETIHGWTLSWNYRGAQQVTEVRGGSFSQGGQTVSVTSGSHNDTIRRDGGRVSISLQGTYSGSAGNPAPSNFFELNGSPCLQKGNPPPPTVPVTRCLVDYDVERQRNGTFRAELKLKNLSRDTVFGWTLNWSFSGDQQVTEVRGGSFTQGGQTVSVTDTGLNAELEGRDRITLVIEGTYSGSNAEPALFKLNQVACSS
jgi:hypothetical protein